VRPHPRGAAMTRTWYDWLARVFNTPGRRRKPFHRAGGPARRLGFEPLECRTVPAASITILDTGLGDLDASLSATDGTVHAADVTAAASGTLSRAALQGVGA